MSELPFLTLLTLRQSGNIHRTACNIQSLIPRFRAVGVLIPPPENNHDPATTSTKPPLIPTRWPGFPIASARPVPDRVFVDTAD